MGDVAGAARAAAGGAARRLPGRAAADAAAAFEGLTPRCGAYAGVWGCRGRRWGAGRCGNRSGDMMQREQADEAIIRLPGTSLA